ncbi:MAG: c-type cytochrome [Ginsengibacter sp.]
MKKYVYSVLIIITCFLSCNTQPHKADFSSSPVTSPEASIAKMQVEEGFEVKLVAAEPLVTAPVALEFDSKGRMWVVEMNGFMPDTSGTGDNIPNGKIVILEDKNKDGVADERKVFLDSLVLPRAICLIENGILVAEPPNLWFYEINNDKPGKKILVDDKFSEGGSVEHQPNGLLRAMDNWIYNAKSGRRYRKNGDKWMIDNTSFRGQWGISQDNYGRLYYNNNSVNLLGDYFTPGIEAINKNQHNVAGFDENLVPDNRVYPARPTPGVNRGYMPGILDSGQRLVEFTAACGPVIYRGDLFGKEYELNAFVAEPSANLIKRNILNENGFITSGRQAYQGREFLSSVDERFRPVNLYNGPDGALYVVDMYRGILQDKVFITPYLRNQVAIRKLTQPLNYGRIYKIVPKNKRSKEIVLPDDPLQLVKLLESGNGWVRDKAQQMLIDGKFTGAVPALQKAIKETDKPLLVIHALWTLEGLGALRTEDVVALLKEPAWPIRMQALSVLPSVMNKANSKQYLAILEELLDQNDTLAAPYIAFIAHAIRSDDKEAEEKLLEKVVKKYPGNRFVADAVISNLQDREELFSKKMLAFAPNPGLAINRELLQITSNKKMFREGRDPEALNKEFPKGMAIFYATCKTCHGPDGNGIKSLAPPLNQSEWVTGDKDKLISILLFGLTGPVKVNGYSYKTPEINGDMPGIGFNKDIRNEDIAQLLSFIRKSWQNNAGNINAEDVEKIRQKLKDRQKAFTTEELK